MSDKDQKIIASEDQTRKIGRLQDELDLLNNVNLSLVNATGIEDTLEKVVEGITEFLGYEAADIMLLSEDKRHLILSAYSLDANILQQIEKIIGLKAKGLKVPLFKQSINWPVIIKGEAIISDDLERALADYSDSNTLRKLAPMLAKISGFKSVIRVPLRGPDGVVGLLGIASSTLLDEDDLQIVQHFAGQAGLAVEKAKLEQRLREYSEHLETMVTERTRELEAINQITATVSRSLNLDIILKNALSKVLEVLEFSVGAIFVTDEKEAKVNLMFHRGLPQDMVTAMSEVEVGMTFAGLVVQKGEPIIENDLVASEHEDEVLKLHPELSSIVAVPLESKGTVRGVLAVISEKQDRFSDAEAKMLVTIGSEVGVALENAWLYEKSYAHSKKMEELSITDSLTSLFNRRHFYRRLKEELARSQRQKHPLSLLVVDLDNLKGYNDKFGHLKGDEALCGVARAIDACIRQDVDTGYRHGGDEFAVILPYGDQAKAIEVAERIRKTFEDYALPGTSLSIGIAQHIEDEELDDLVTRADTAMYVAKNFGGNRVYVEKS